MKVIKIILKGLFWLLIVALLVAPLGLIYEISRQEMEQYKTPETPRVRDVSIGAAVQARKQDMQERITLSGHFTSSSYAYQELSFRYPDRIRWWVGIRDEVQVGQVLGTYQGEEILSEYAGLISEMNAYNSNNSYLRIQLLTPLEFECNVSDTVLKRLMRCDSLQLEDGIPVTISYISLVKNTDGSNRIRLQFEREEDGFGETVENLEVYTGFVYRQATVLSADCVYQRVKGEEQPWFVREVTEDGYFVQEIEVEVGYSDGNLVCVSGLRENAWYDSGYKAIVEGT